MTWIAFGYVALGFALTALGLPAARACRICHLLAAWAAALLMLIGAGTALAGSAPAQISLHLSVLPALGFTLDPLRGFFLLIAASVHALSVAFIVRDSREHAALRGRALLAWTTLLQAATVAVLLSTTVLSFMFTWEVMSLALWALVTFDTRNPLHVRAGYVTLGLSEAGALAALAGLLILSGAAGSSSFSGIAAAAPHLSPRVVWPGFLLTFFGFGVKTGIVPVNTWMGAGYTAAPRSLRPLFSGATMNLGVFSLWVIDGPLATHALWPALIVLVVGALTAILGIVYALVQSDMSRLLTHSSIENLGIVVAALGAGYAFSALGDPVLGGMALVAGLYHMLNHSAYKTLLFLGAGGIDAVTGTHALDRLGGLLRRLPLFGTLFLLGALAIAALPPFNGFVSEWLTLESLLRVVQIAEVPVRFTFALSGALLALTAGLAMTCFVMLAGTSLLGLPRSHEAAAAAGMPRSVTVPMAVLAVVCFGLGVLATAVIPALGRLVAPLAGADPTAALVPAFFRNAHGLPGAIVTDLTHIGAQVGRGVLPLRGLVVLHSGGLPTPVIFAMSTGLVFTVIATLVLIVWIPARVLRRPRVRRAPLWAAGLARLRPEMTYNATAFAAPVRALFDTLLRPAVDEHVERQGAFATAVHRESRMVHIADRLTLHPLVAGMLAVSEKLARMHQGKVNVYAGYVVLALVAILIATGIALR
ncbi:MAG TPA: proton-conducting transporter membrane subunit [Gammaproteobacteria bacterium]|nr:proton-conducting transporter membrane subunit [Gammaproteobacteria bacterium]